MILAHWVASAVFIYTCMCINPNRLMQPCTLPVVEGCCSCLHTILASRTSQRSSQTELYSSFIQISTRPSIVEAIHLPSHLSSNIFVSFAAVIRYWQNLVSSPEVFSRDTNVLFSLIPPSTRRICRFSHSNKNSIYNIQKRLQFTLIKHSEFLSL